MKKPVLNNVTSLPCRGCTRRCPRYVDCKHRKTSLPQGIPAIDQSSDKPGRSVR